jgi:hypothetical protein
VTISEEEKYKTRVEIEHRFVQSLVLINSGAIIALLGFTQAVIATNPELAKVSLVGIRYFCGGLVSGVLVNYFRYRVNTLKASNNASESDRNKRLSYFFRFLSLILFVVGAAYVSTQGIEYVGS